MQSQKKNREGPSNTSAQQQLICKKYKRAKKSTPNSPRKSVIVFSAKNQTKKEQQKHENDQRLDWDIPGVGGVLPLETSLPAAPIVVLDPVLLE